MRIKFKLILFLIIILSLFIFVDNIKKAIPLEVKISINNTYSHYLASYHLLKKEFNFSKYNDDVIQKVNNVNKYSFFKSELLFQGDQRGTNNSAFIDKYENNLFLISQVGLFSYTNLPELNQDKLNFKIIKSNILKFIDDYGYDKRTGIRDVYIDERKSKIYVSLTNELKKDCFNTSVIQSNLNYDYLDFTELLVPNECISLNNDYGEFNFLQHGGRVSELDSLNILLSTGEYRYRTKSQLDNNLFGKIIKVNKSSGEYKIISKGHRNPQGLKFFKEKNIIISTDHGPAGGDEINIQSLSDSIYNFGWPISSYGYHYNRNAPMGDHRKADTSEIADILIKAPLYKSHIDYNFTEPIKYFTPSIGISEIDYFTNDQKIFLLISSMGDKSQEGALSLHFYDFDENEIIQTIKFERRIRDFFIDRESNMVYISFETYGGLGLLKL